MITTIYNTTQFKITQIKVGLLLVRSKERKKKSNSTPNQTKMSEVKRDISFILSLSWGWGDDKITNQFMNEVRQRGILRNFQSQKKA